MQIIYAAPFILLSLICFAVFMGVPSLRRQALPALVAPVAFGVCSLAGWIVFALIGWRFLHLQSNPKALLVAEGLLFYLFPGLVGAWFAVTSVRFLERKFLTTKEARNLIIRLVVSLIACGIGFVVGLGIADNVLPPDSTYPAFLAALVSAGAFAVLTFIAVMLGQRRTAKRTVELRNGFAE